MSGTGAARNFPLTYAPLRFQLASGGRSASSSNVLVVCPKCESAAFIRKSERMTEKVKYLTCHCTNSGCGHIFKMELVFVHSLVEGNIDRPELDLPVCPRDQVEHVLTPPNGHASIDQISMFEIDSS